MIRTGQTVDFFYALRYAALDYQNGQPESSFVAIVHSDCTTGQYRNVQTLNYRPDGSLSRTVDGPTPVQQADHGSVIGSAINYACQVGQNTASLSPDVYVQIHKQNAEMLAELAKVRS